MGYTVEKVFNAKGLVTSIVIIKNHQVGVYFDLDGNPLGRIKVYGDKNVTYDGLLHKYRDFI